MNQTIQANPVDLSRHGAAFADHVPTMSSIRDDIHALMRDPGIGDDDFGRSFRATFLPNVLALADSIGDAGSGILGISTNMREMAGAYAETDQYSLDSVLHGSGSSGPAVTGGPHATPHRA
ncbi:hypothetical protein GCM10009839_23980 [Catenulispora yoronensis]|uniref:ESX-1 secretion-associated protein n=1 Tax=Catenulispora yoronensis TaxID=450799 RepID=A0ABP5FEW6_9ACTN